MLLRKGSCDRNYDWYCSAAVLREGSCERSSATTTAAAGLQCDCGRDGDGGQRSLERRRWRLPSRKKGGDSRQTQQNQQMLPQTEGHCERSETSKSSAVRLAAAGLKKGDSGQLRGNCGYKRPRTAKPEHRKWHPCNWHLPRFAMGSGATSHGLFTLLMTTARSQQRVTLPGRHLMVRATAPCG